MRPGGAHFITIWDSLVTSGLLASLVDEGPAAERNTASSASEDTVMVISLLELDCMRYSVKIEETLICLYPFQYKIRVHKCHY